MNRRQSGRQWTGSCLNWYNSEKPQSPKVAMDFPAHSRERSSSQRGQLGHRNQPFSRTGRNHCRWRYNNLLIILWDRLGSVTSHADRESDLPPCLLCGCQLAAYTCFHTERARSRHQCSNEKCTHEAGSPVVHATLLKLSSRRTVAQRNDVTDCSPGEQGSRCVRLQLFFHTPPGLIRCEAPRI